MVYKAFTLKIKKGHGRTDGRTDEQDGRTDGRTDERTLVIVESLSRLKMPFVDEMSFTIIYLNTTFFQFFD